MQLESNYVMWHLQVVSARSQILLVPSLQESAEVSVGPRAPQAVLPSGGDGHARQRWLLRGRQRGEELQLSQGRRTSWRVFSGCSGFYAGAANITDPASRIGLPLVGLQNAMNCWRIREGVAGAGRADHERVEAEVKRQRGESRWRALLHGKKVVSTRNRCRKAPSIQQSARLLRNRTARSQLHKCTRD